jgi:hypothetical protein
MKTDSNSQSLIRRGGQRPACVKILLGALLLASVAVTDMQGAFSLVDNFTGLTPGNLNGQNNWVATGATVVQDPDDAANLVFGYLGTGSDRGSFKTVTIPNGTTATLFFRLRVDSDNNNSATPVLNWTAGMSDVALTSGNGAYADFESAVNQNRDAGNPGYHEMRARDGGSYVQLETLQSNVWYSVWMVINNTTDTTRMYMQGGQLAVQTLLDDPTGKTAFTFRNGAAANDLVRFFVRLSATHAGNFYLDDIYLDQAGENLANPLEPFPNAPMGFTLQPVSLNVPENVAVMFTAGVTGAAPRHLQWQRSDGMGGFTNIALATGYSYSLPLVTPSDNGAQFRLTASNLFSSATSSVADLTVQTDTTLPTVVGVGAPGNFTNVVIRFSEKIVITDTLNFLSDNMAIRTMAVDSTGSNVLLTIDPIQPAETHTVAIEGVSDRAATPNTIVTTNVTVLSPVLACGFIRGDYFQNVTTTTIDDLIANAKFPANVDETLYFTDFNSRSGYAEQYGLRMWGWFVPPTNGHYTFYIRSDDDSRLYISSNDNPANKAIVAVQTGANQEYTNTAAGTPRFGTISNMVAGQRYYMEALLREGTGGDYVTVVAKGAGEPPPLSATASTVNPISGDWFCSYADPNGASIVITNQPQSRTNTPPAAASFTVGARAAPANYASVLRYQWQKNGVNIAGANAATFSIAVTSVADQGNYRCVLAVPTLSVTSQVATLSLAVQPTIGPPSVSGGTVSFAVPTVGGSQYAVLYSTNLAPANWQPLTNTAGTGSPILIYDTVTGRSQRFYRVRVD